MNLKDELLAIKEEMLQERENDVIQRTLSKLIAIEKEAVYGSKASSKNTRMEKVIETEFKAYKEKMGASKKN